MKTETVSNRNVKYQYFAAISANLILIGFGAGVGWLNPALSLLQSDKTPLNPGPLDNAAVSWIGSITSLGAVTGNFIVGGLVDLIGAKNVVLVLGVPQLLAWLLMIFGDHVYYLYMARYITGIVGGGSQVGVSLFVAEIADNDIRGILGTFLQVSRNTGILLAYVLGFYTSYVISAMAFSIVSVIFLASFLFLPSSTQHLLKKEKVEAAEKAFKFYKGYKGEDNSKFDMTQFDHIKYAAKEVNEDSKITLNDLWEARGGLVQAIIVPLLNQLTGQYVFLTYGATVIQSSGTQLPVEMATISLAVVAIIGPVLTTQLVDSKGRRFLLIFSSAGCAVGHAVMITYLVLHKNGIDTSLFHWTPVLCMTTILLIATAGIIPLTYICLVEAIPMKIRSFGVTFGNVTVNMFAFIVAKSFPLMKEAIGLESCLAIFSVQKTLAKIIYCFFMLIHKYHSLFLSNLAALNRNKN